VFWRWILFLSPSGKNVKRFLHFLTLETLSYLELYLGSQQSRNFFVLNLPENENRVYFQSAEVLLKIMRMM
jgi:hypothetical protein